MRTKRKQEPEPTRAREPSDRLWCEWSSTTHARCHKIAEPGIPFCMYHAAAAHGMARGASTPDEKTRALFEHLWDYYEEER